ncbi:dipeptidase PepE [Comamonas endophytica]|uniref:Dipeptidase PepE n=1 Tax=Comamonas endophytica TaxID=2949090 RepID=A0ABY6G7K7_9BURK|nr:MULTISPECIES: dipeptidase PepE [unclassified Acidovorax]MCD2511511.1 dipeptidase PepE [Acidovorax sp. D4N7]UYG50898.1 dipeptidase PepE [Acidovorax sp. 5MLIR]
MQLLLLSNSSSPQGFLTHALPDIRQWAGPAPENASVLFVPYAGVTRTWDEYETLVADALRPTGLAVRSLHREAAPLAAIAGATHIVVGGGNTFALVRQLRQTGQLAAIAERVRSGGARYLGWSAGANLACPRLCTSNDMPIVDPLGFDTLGLVPFQINPHYTEAHPEGHRGETRQQRLREFALLNPGVPVLGLPEGTGVRIDGDSRTLLGDPQTPARWFTGVQAPALLPMGSWKS